MISVHPISEKVHKYCTHCDAPASYEINLINPIIIQQQSSACLCDLCMGRLKEEMLKVSIPAIDFPIDLYVIDKAAKEFINCSCCVDPEYAFKKGAFFQHQQLGLAPR